MLTEKLVCIDQDRLWASHMAMAQIGALSKGGNCRLALSSEDKRGRDLFVSWCREAGLGIRMDQIGNIYARRSGRNNSLPPAATGSHLDTQPHGGKFDGIYGVLAGLEVIRTLDDYDIETDAPVEVIVWTNEEGVRFSPPLMGSLVFSGRLPIEQAHSVTTVDGTTVLEDLHAIGYFGDEISSNDHELACFIECHIEQGPILEQKNLQIGVVTKIQGVRGFSVKVNGVDNHAGTTPLNLRQDALVGAAKMVIRLNEIGLSGDEFTRITVGRFEILPNSMSSIPGEAFFYIDLRHPDLDVLDNLEREFREEIQSIASGLGLEIDVDRFLAIAPTDFDPDMIDTVHREVKKLGYTHQKMLSGAGHDAMNIASVAPTAMIFVPCEGGISHNEAEAASPEDLAAGANVLLHSLLSYGGHPVSFPRR